MTHAEVATILRQFNAWRRGDCAPFEQPEPPEPYEVSLAIDEAVAMIDAAEKERDALRAEVIYWKEQKEPGAAGWRAIAHNLRAKIASMERQKPVGTALLCARCSTPFDGDHYCPACEYHTATEEDVYALPGALGEER